MDIPSLFSRKRAVPVAEDTFFLALVITNVTVQAGLWKVSADGELAVDSISAAKGYTAEDIDELLIAADKALQELGPDSEKTDEVVFGFEFDWVEGSTIKEDRKSMLKQLSSELSLKPVGFVVVTEALLHGFQKKDPNCSLLLIQVSAHQVTVSLIQQGVIHASEKVGRSDVVVSDVIEALTRFNQVAVARALPGKMIIAGIGIQTKVSRDLQQDLLSYDWSTQFDFVHAPVVEIMTEQQVLNSVIEESGKAVAQAKGLMLLDSTSVGAVNAAAQPKQAVQPIQAAQSKQEVPRLESDAPITPAPTSFGVPISSNKPPMMFDNAVLSHDLSNNKNVVQQGTGPASSTTTAPTSVNLDTKENLVSAEALQVKDSHSKGKFSLNVLDWWKYHRRVVVGGFLAGLLALFGLAFASSIVLRQAIVELKLREEFISRTVMVSLDPSITESRPEDLLLKAETISETVSGTDSIAASGVRLVGEKATGKVTIFNKTDAVKTFAAGTILRSGTLRFELSESVEVASATTEVSRQDSETRVFGKAEVAVVAQDIGAQFNLAKDTEFQVADFASSSYTALAETAFTGGSSREVRVVSQEDVNKLLASVKSSLVEDATEKFRGQSRNGRYVVPTGQVRVVSSSYDAKVGDEVSRVELNLELKVFAVVYAQDDIKPLITTVLSSEVPEGYELSEDNLQILTDTSGGNRASQETEEVTSSSRVRVELQISTTATPILDDAKMREAIAGKPIAEVSSILTEFTGVRGVEVKIQPAFTQRFFQSLPSDPSKITITVPSDDTN